MFGGHVGLLAACLLVVSPVLATDAHMARADEVLLFTTTLAMCALWRLWRMHRIDPRARGGLPLGSVALLWIAVALGILAKGPITPFVAATCAMGAPAARREWRFIWRIRPFFGLFVLAALATPWIWLAGNEVGWDTLKAAFEKEVLQRAQQGAEGHAAPPGYYLVTLVAFFFPGSLLTALAFGRLFMRAFAARAAAGAGFPARMRAGSRARAVATRRRSSSSTPSRRGSRSNSSSRSSPLHPPDLSGHRALHGALRARRTARAAEAAQWRRPLRVRRVDGGRLAPRARRTCAVPHARRAWQTAPALPAWPPLEDSASPVFVLASLGSIAAVALLVVAWRAALAGGFARALAIAIPATVLAQMALFGVWIPNTRWIWNTPRIVGIVAADSGKVPTDEGFPRIAGIGYQEDSLLWTTRNRLVRFGDTVNAENRDAILTWARANPGAYLLIPRASAADFASVARVVGDLVGFNYSDGDPVDHVVMRTGE